SVKALRNNAVARSEAVDLPLMVARQELFRLPQCRFQQVLGKDRAGHVAVEAVTGIIGMEADDAVERMRPDFRLQQSDFRLARIPPEQAVEVDAGSRMPRVVLEAGWIAEWVEEEAIALREFGIFFQRRCETRQRQRAFRFIAVNGGENANSNSIAAALGAEENVARHHVFLAVAFELAERLFDQVVGLVGELVELGQQPIRRAPLGQWRFDDWLRGGKSWFRVGHINRGWWNCVFFKVCAG